MSACTHPRSQRDTASDGRFYCCACNATLDPETGAEVHEHDWDDIGGGTSRCLSCGQFYVASDYSPPVEAKYSKRLAEQTFDGRKAFDDVAREMERQIRENAAIAGMTPEQTQRMVEGAMRMPSDVESRRLAPVEPVVVRSMAEYHELFGPTPSPPGPDLYWKPSLRERVASRLHALADRIGA